MHQGIFSQKQGYTIYRHGSILPENFPRPQVGLEDLLQQVVSDIITILTDTPSTTTLKLQVGDATKFQC